MAPREGEEKEPSARRHIKVGRDEVLFLIGTVGITASAVAAIGFGRPADATLVAAFLSLLIGPVFLNSDRKRQEEEDQ